MQISNDVRQHGVHTHRFHRRRAVAALLFALGLCLGIPGASEAIGPFTNLGITGGTAQHREFAAPEDLVITSLGVLARTNTLDAPGDVVITHNGVDTPLRLTYPPGVTGPLTGRSSIHVQEGEIFGFRTDGSVATTGDARLTIVIYSQPANAFAVPAVSPAGLLLLGVAIAGLAWFRLRSMA